MKGIEFTSQKDAMKALAKVNQIEADLDSLDVSLIHRGNIITDKSKIKVRKIPYTSLHKSLNGKKWFMFADEKVENILGKQSVEINKSEYFTEPHFIKKPI